MRIFISGSGGSQLITTLSLVEREFCKERKEESRVGGERLY
jgi:hypothetical protein